MSRQDNVGDVPAVNTRRSKKTHLEQQVENLTQTNVELRSRLERFEKLLEANGVTLEAQGPPPVEMPHVESSQPEPRGRQKSAVKSTVPAPRKSAAKAVLDLDDSPSVIGPNAGKSTPKTDSRDKELVQKNGRDHQSYCEVIGHDASQEERVQAKVQRSVQFLAWLPHFEFRLRLRFGLI